MVCSCFVAFVVVVLSDGPGRNRGLGLVGRGLVEPPPPGSFIAGRPKAALLFCLLLLFFSLFDSL